MRVSESVRLGEEIRDIASWSRGVARNLILIRAGMAGYLAKPMRRRDLDVATQKALNEK